MDKTIRETLEHKHRVQELMNAVIIELINRATTHDNSKLGEHELEQFAKLGKPLEGITYGSEEYKEQINSILGDALKHHYENNRHHPEHHPNGIKDMDLLDILEMLVDWRAATERHKDGDIYRSIEINQDRFRYGDELKGIFKNTVDRYL